MDLGLQHPYFYHNLAQRPAPITIGPGNLADPARFEAIGRVVAEEFVRSTGGRIRGLDDLWGRGGMSSHLPLCEIIFQNDHNRVSDYISDLHRNELGKGMKWQCTWADFVTGAGAARNFSFCLYDRIISLCEALRLRDIRNPESANYSAIHDEDAEVLLKLIDAYLGYEAHSPSCFSLAYGAVRPSGATLDERAVHAVYTAERVLTLLASMGIAPENASVLEIGGGIGNLAYNLLKRGIGRYALVDIPTVRAIQTFMTLYEFPDIRVNFAAADVSGEARMHLLTPDGLPALADRSVHIAINEDSLTEIQQDVAIGYLNQIARISSGYFLSINHESGDEILGHRHTPVAALADHAPRLRPLSRSRHWLRPGYVEELFAPA